MLRIGLTVALLAAGALPGFASDWSSLPPLPTARFGAGAAFSGDAAYVFGGNNGSDLATVTRWDPVSGVWSAANPMSTTRHFLGGASLNGSVYAVGGLNVDGMALASVERMDGSGTWGPVAQMPAGRALMGVAELNGLLYVLGGEGQNGILAAETFRFDAGTNSWTTMASIPTARSGPAAAALNGEIFVMGGASGFALSSVEVFDPAANTWRIGPDMPEALWMPSAATFDGRIWIVGGFDAQFARSDRAYSLGTGGVWQQETSLPFAAAGAAAASNGGRLIVAGGMDSFGQPMTSAATRESDTPPPPPPPPPAEDTLHVNVELHPGHVNMKSHGKWVSGEIWADDWSVESIDVASISLGGIAVDMDGPMSFDDEDGFGRLKVKFPREAFRALGDGSHVLTLRAVTHEGAAVTGTCDVDVNGSWRKSDGFSDHQPALKPVGSRGRFNAVEFTVASPGEVQVDVLDVQGRVVDRLGSGFFSPGTHQMQWATGPQMQPGIYFIRARMGDQTQVGRLAVLR